MNVQLPEINLNGLLPVAGLALIAVLCIAALLVRSLLHSRIALLIAVVAGVVAAGPTLAFALTQIVGALVPLGVVVVIGGVAVVWLLNRNPELMALVRDVVPRKETPTSPPTPLLMPGKTPGTYGGEGSRTIVIDQPREQNVRRLPVPRDQGDKWGF
jgi:hypothetical protein